MLTVGRVGPSDLSKLPARDDRLDRHMHAVAIGRQLGLDVGEQRVVGELLRPTEGVPLELGAELSLEEVGRVEGIPIGTVKSRLSRAKEKLRSALHDLAERR